MSRVKLNITDYRFISIYLLIATITRAPNIFEVFTFIDGFLDGHSFEKLSSANKTLTQSFPYYADANNPNRFAKELLYLKRFAPFDHFGKKNTHLYRFAQTNPIGNEDTGTGQTKCFQGRSKLVFRGIEGGFVRNAYFFAVVAGIA